MIKLLFISTKPRVTILMKGHLDAEAIFMQFAWPVARVIYNCIRVKTPSHGGEKKGKGKRGTNCSSLRLLDHDLLSFRSDYNAVWRHNGRCKNKNRCRTRKICVLSRVMEENLVGISRFCFIITFLHTWTWYIIMFKKIEK